MKKIILFVGIALLLFGCTNPFEQQPGNKTFQETITFTATKDCNKSVFIEKQSNEVPIVTLTQGTSCEQIPIQNPDTNAYSVIEYCAYIPDYTVNFDENKTMTDAPWRAFVIDVDGAKRTVHVLNDDAVYSSAFTVKFDCGS